MSLLKLSVSLGMVHGNDDEVHQGGNPVSKSSESPIKSVPSILVFEDCTLKKSTIGKAMQASQQDLGALG